MEENLNKNLKIAIILTSIIFFMELIGGVLSNSLALLSDSAHVFMDVVALLLSYGAIKISARPSNSSMTFGYHRFEIFASLINGVTIIGIAFFIFYEAYERIFYPPVVKGAQVLVIATIGLIVNSWAALKLHGHSDLNIKSAYLHVIGDALASVAVIAGAVIILLTGNNIIDPMLSIFIAAMLLYGAFRLVIGSMRILLEFAPKHVDAFRLSKEIMVFNGIKGVHDIHIWSICSNIHAMSAHIQVDRMHVHQTETFISDISKMVSDKFNIMHATLQFECAECTHVEIGHKNHHQEEH
jgi:cobalt-zinc-cadmium efflux system protein